MNNWKRKVFTPLAVVAFIAFAIFMVIAQTKAHETKIANWAAEHDYEVVSINQTFFDYGPFWYCDEDQTIYKTVMRDKFEKERIVYFRIGWWLEAAPLNKQ